MNIKSYKAFSKMGGIHSTHCFVKIWGLKGYKKRKEHSKYRYPEKSK